MSAPYPAGKIDDPDRSGPEEGGQRLGPRRSMAFSTVTLERSSTGTVELGGGGPPQPAYSFAALVRTHEPALRATALRLCRSRSDAHDLVQDTLERGLRSFRGLPAGSNVRAWLLSILRNRFIDACRRGSREKQQDGTPPADSLPAPEGPEPEPGWAKITIEQLRAAVERLPQEFSAVYRMHCLEGRSYVEIADALRIPKATVGTRLIRARRKLRDLLVPRLAEEEEP